VARDEDLPDRAPLNYDLVTWFWAAYLPSGPSRDGDVSPYLFDPDDRAGLPPTLLHSAQHDPLREEGDDFAVMLADAGVPVTAVCYRDAVHGFTREFGSGRPRPST
jgi:acetyl esterase